MYISASVRRFGRPPACAHLCVVVSRDGEARTGLTFACIMQANGGTLNRVRVLNFLRCV